MCSIPVWFVEERMGGEWRGWVVCASFLSLLQLDAFLAKMDDPNYW